jgi:hypothetical protein
LLERKNEDAPRPLLPGPSLGFAWKRNAERRSFVCGPGFLELLRSGKLPGIGPPTALPTGQSFQPERMPFSRLLRRLLAVCIFGVPIQASSLSGIDTARKLADAAPDAGLRDELRHDLAAFLARRGDSAGARSAAAQRPPGRQAMVLFELAAHQPDLRSKEAEQLALAAQTAKALSNDWRKARVANLLAVACARLGKFDAAVALSDTVPDTEEKASALQAVVAELNRTGELAKARGLAGTIEEIRRYGTYLQKAAALADPARTLHARGDPDDTATLLAQAELLLFKKPGWSDGAAYRDVAVAAYRCGQKLRPSSCSPVPKRCLNGSPDRGK